MICDFISKRPDAALSVQRRVRRAPIPIGFFAGNIAGNLRVAGDEGIYHQR
jgi:hypothetical protein